MSQPQQDEEPVDRLSTLPDDVLGLVFSKLRDLRTPTEVVDESSQALLQTCKTIRSSPACLAQITTLNLFISRDNFGEYVGRGCTNMDMTLQLRALPPGASAHVNRVRVASNKKEEAHCIASELHEDDEYGPGSLSFFYMGLGAETMKALAQDIARCAPWMLQGVTELVIGRSCSVEREYWEEPHQENLMDTIVAAFPNLVSLQIYASHNPQTGSGGFMKSTSHLRLRSLIIEPSQACDTVLYKKDCAAISRTETLSSLTLSKFDLIKDISRFQSLTNLQSLCLNVGDPIREDISQLSTLTGLTSLTLSTIPTSSWKDPPGLCRLLNDGCTNLKELTLGGLRFGAELKLPKLEQFRLVQRRNHELLPPFLQSLPALKSLHIGTWVVGGSASALSGMLALLQSVPHSISFTLGSLIVKCDALCSCLLQSLPSECAVPSLCCLRCDNMQFEPQQLALLACHFPGLLELKTKACELSAGSAMEVVQCFPHLRRWTMSHPTLPREHFLDAVAEAQRSSNKFELIKAKVVPWVCFGFGDDDD